MTSCSSMVSTSEGDGRSRSYIVQTKGIKLWSLNMLDIVSRARCAADRWPTSLCELVWRDGLRASVSEPYDVGACV